MSKNRSLLEDDILDEISDLKIGLTKPVELNIDNIRDYFNEFENLIVIVAVILIHLAN